MKIRRFDMKDFVFKVRLSLGSATALDSTRCEALSSPGTGF
jgi:hypothetical protein